MFFVCKLNLIIFFENKPAGANADENVTSKARHHQRSIQRHARSQDKFEVVKRLILKRNRFIFQFLPSSAVDFCERLEQVASTVLSILVFRSQLVPVIPEI